MFQYIWLFSIIVCYAVLTICLISSTLQSARIPRLLTSLGLWALLLDSILPKLITWSKLLPLYASLVGTQVRLYLHDSWACSFIDDFPLTSLEHDPHRLWHRLARTYFSSLSKNALGTPRHLKQTKLMAVEKRKVECGKGKFGISSKGAIKTWCVFIVSIWW